MRIPGAAALLCGLLVHGTATAQLLKRLNPFDSIPEVSVSLTHPPRLGHQIQEIRKVAFAEAEGECADDLVDALVSDFVGNGVEVLDRQNLQALLDEHKLTASGIVDRNSAEELGKILGASALIFVKVRRCTTTASRSTNHRKSLSGRIIYEYIAKTNAYFKGAVQVVDLSTARLYSARSVDEVVTRSVSSPSGPPEAPDRFEALDAVIRRAADRVDEMFFPWSEYRTLRYYDGKECDLNLAYNLVNSGQIEEAIRQSKLNVEVCEASKAKKPKPRARAYYNLGMAYCLGDKFSAGIESLNVSLRLRPHEPTSEAIAECQRAQLAAQRMEEFAEEAEMLAGDARAGRTDSHEPVEEQVARLLELYEKKLLTKEVCRTQVESILMENGLPAGSAEEKLRLLKSYFERGLVGDEAYKSLVDQVLGAL